MISLEPMDTSTPVGRNFEILRRLVMDTGGRSLLLRAGTATVTWGGVNSYAEVTVNHGLGKAIVAEYAVANSAFGGVGYAAMTNGHSSTTLTIRLAEVNGTVVAAGTTTPVSWLVIG